MRSKTMRAMSKIFRNNLLVLNKLWSKVYFHTLVRSDHFAVLFFLIVQKTI